MAGSTVEIPPYAPDVSDLGTATSVDVLNVVARGDGYGPFQSLESFTQALPAPCRGYFFARKSDGSIAIFAGTATELYLLDNTTFNWNVVSKATYSPLVSTDNWQFAQFNDLVIAVQVNTVPQKFNLSSSTQFADLGGSPPAAGHIAIVGFFVVLTKLLANTRRVHWSDLSAPETWSAGVGLADFEDLPDGGSTLGISGGDAFGIVFQESSIRSFTYASGSPTVFQINRISTEESLEGEYSIIQVGERTFYHGAAGFKMIQGSGRPEAIGKELVDRTFSEDVDPTNLQLLIGSSDPTTTRVYWAYKSQQGAVGLFDKILCYDWFLKRWTPLSVSGEYIASLAKPGVTLEGLDAIAPGALQVLGAANNGSGLIRLALNATSNAFFNIAGQNFIVVQGVDPTYMNGTWRVNIIDSTHIDLIGSVFGAPYVSGGAIGGSLDALSFSLDSISKASQVQLSGFGPTNKLGFFSGANLEATMETAEVDGEGIMLFTSGTRVISDAATIYVSTGWRNNPNVALTYTSEEVTDDTGWAPQLIESRYQRERIRIAAGASWTYCRGVQPDGMGAGER
jgi:hypothetical protein